MVRVRTYPRGLKSDDGDVTHVGCDDRRRARRRIQGRRGIQRLVLLGTLLVLFLLGGTAPASAHAALRATDPEDGSVLKSAPVTSP